MLAGWTISASTCPGTVFPVWCEPGPGEFPCRWANWAPGGWGPGFSCQLLNQSLIASHPWWVLSAGLKTIDWISRCLEVAGCLISDGSGAGGHLEPMFPSHMSSSVRRRCKPSVFLGSKRTELLKSDRKTNQAGLHYGKLALSLLVKWDQLCCSIWISYWSVPRWPVKCLREGVRVIRLHGKTWGLASPQK